MKMNDENEIMEKINALSIQTVFSPSYLVNILSDFEKANQFYRSINKNPSANLPDTIFEGYKLAFSACYYNSFDLFDPLPLGIECDEVLRTKSYWSNDPISTYPDNSDHGVLIQNLWILRKKVLSAKTWDELKISLAETFDFHKAITGIFEESYSTTLRGKEINTTETLRQLSIEQTLITLNDLRRIEIAYTKMYEPGSSVTIEKLINNEISMSPRANISNVPKRFFEGYRFANLFIWYSLLGEEKYKEFIKIFEGIAACNEWYEFDEWFSDLNDKIGWRFGGGDEIGSFLFSAKINAVKEIDSEKRKILITRKYEPVTKSLDYNDIFEHRPVRVIAYKHSIAGIGLFQMCLNGLLVDAIRENDHVRVLRIKHPNECGFLYSYAIYMPAFGTFTNASEYWLFYSYATDFSGTGGQAYALTEKLLSEYSDYVHVIEHIVNDDEYFIDYLRSKRTKILNTKVNELISMNDGMRGLLLESLVGIYLNSVGYSDIKLRTKLPFLGGKEIDVIGIKHCDGKSEIAVVECKGNLAVSTISELESVDGEVHHFPSKSFKEVLKFGQLYVGLNGENKQPFLDKLGISGDVSMKGIVVSLNLAASSVDTLIPPELEYWPWAVLREKMRARGLPRRVYGLIDDYLVWKAITAKQDDEGKFREGPDDLGNYDDDDT